MLLLRSILSCERRKASEDVVSANNPSPLSLYDTVSWEGGASCGGEKGRFGSILGLRMLDTTNEPAFDRITNMMSAIFKTPVSLITLVAEPERVWFKSCVGPFGSCVVRDGSWCNYVLVPPTPEVLITEDASKDARFAHNPYVAGDPFIKFYAGAPLVGSRGERYGTLCVVDLKQRSFTAELYSLLINFAALAVEEIERNKPLSDVASQAKVNDVERNRHLDLSLNATKRGIVMVDVRSGGWPIKYVNPAFETTTCLAQSDSEDSISGKDFWDLFSAASMTREEIADVTGQGQQFDLRLTCKQSGTIFTMRLMPATSDRLAPSKASGIPAYVPSEDAPKGTKLGCDVDKDKIVDIKDRDLDFVTDTKCFWFATIMGSSPGSSASESTQAGSGSGSGSQSNQNTGKSSNASFDCGFGEYVIPDLGDKLGRLKLGPLLGSGSFGKVYRSVAPDDTAVAIKVVDCRNRHEEITAEQMAEVKLSEELDHEGIVKVLAHTTSTEVVGDQSRQVLWIVQELCDLGTLTNAAECGWLRKERKIDSPPCMPVVLRTLLDLASAMAYLHDQKIIHADLTGRNVLLASSDKHEHGFVAKVADFGKARMAAPDGEAQVLDKLGTITHMPPELLVDNYLFPQADVWSFGVIAWEAYYGKRAYCGRSVPQIILAVASKNALEWPADTEPGFLALMKKVLAFHHYDRPSFSEAEKELQALIKQL